jgi:hypothetical protein
MTRLRQTLAAISRANRSQITNGSRLLGNVDGRSAAARRFRDVVRSLEAEFEVITAGDRALIRSAAQLILEAEMLQSARARGEDVDSDIVVKLTGALRRVLSDVKRRVAATSASTASPLSLLEHFANQDDAQDEEAEA